MRACKVEERAMPSKLRARIHNSERYKWFALSAVMLGTVMGPLDASVANVAIPAIGKAFGHGVDDVEWVLLAYMLVTASTLVLFGRVGDLIGQKRIYLGGFAIFGIGSLACAFAPTLGTLIAARVFQALGAAMLMSCTVAIITDVFPSAQRGRAIGMNGGAVAVGLSTGPIVGGFIITYFDWRWIFLINVPVSIAALLMAAFVLKREPGKRDTFDFAGAMLLGAGLFGISLALSRAHLWGWGSPLTIGVLIVSLASIALFVRVEHKTQAPMLDLKLFTNRRFAFSVVAALLYFIANSSVVFVVPLAAQIALGKSALQAGLLLLPISLLSIVLAPTAGALSDRIPARYISTFGSTTFAIGALFLALLPHHPAPWLIACAVVVAGFGTSVFSQPNNSTIMGSAPPHQRGVAAGILSTARTTGQLLGVAIGGAIYFGRAAQLTAKPQSAALAHTFVPASTVFYAVAALMVLVTIISYNRDTVVICRRYNGQHGKKHRNSHPRSRACAPGCGRHAGAP